MIGFQLSTTSMFTSNYPARKCGNTACAANPMITPATPMNIHPARNAKITTVGWIAAAGMFTLLTLALTWLTVAFGLLANTPAGANSLALIPAIVPFVSSAFIPTAAMSGPVRWFAQNEPFTPIIDTLRGLLTGTGIGNSAIIAIAWCAGLTLAAYFWARALYNRRPAA